MNDICNRFSCFTEELSPAEYELRCITLPNEMAELNRTGVKPGVTARWDEEPRLSTYVISEDNVEPAVEEFDKSQVIEASAPETNNSMKLLDILIGNSGNDTVRPDEIAERLFSLNDTMGTELVNASLGSDLGGDFDLVALNDTFNYLLTNDFDAPDFNENFDADFLPDDLDLFNETIENDSLNNTMDILLLNGSIDANVENSSLDLNFSNDSNDSNIFNSTNDLDISNSTLDTESVPLNDSSGVEIFNSSLGLDMSNSSLETEGLPLEEFNSSLSNSSFDEKSLNDSLELVFSNESNEETLNNLSGNVSNSDIEVDFSNNSLSNETFNIGLDLDSSNESLTLNSSAEADQDYLEMINESLQMNETGGSVDELLELFDSSFNDSLNLFLESFNQSSLDKILDANAIREDYENVTDGDYEFEMNDSDLINESQTTEGLIDTSSLFTANEDLENANVSNGSLDVDTVNGSSELLSESGPEDIMSSNETIGEESMNDKLANSAEKQIEDKENATAVENAIMDLNVADYLKKANSNGTESTPGGSYSQELNDATSNEGGMEETPWEESPDLGLAISNDGTHFIGSSGKQIKPVSYNDDADEDVDKVDELVAEGNFNNRKYKEFPYIFFSNTENIGVRNVIVYVVGIGYGNTSSNPLRFT